MSRFVAPDTKRDPAAVEWVMHEAHDAALEMIRRFEREVRRFNAAVERATEAHEEKKK